MKHRVRTNDKSADSAKSAHDGNADPAIPNSDLTDPLPCEQLRAHREQQTTPRHRQSLLAHGQTAEAITTDETS